MLLEKNLGLPILQIDIGKFSVACDYSMAILHSRKLVVAQITSTEQFSNFRVLYEHAFDRNSFNFISGNFGKSSKQIICVQSVDGALFFYEHETMLFQIQLPDFLIPGPLLYVSNIDSLIITNTNLELECYRFHSLQAYTNNNIAAQKAAQADGQKARLEPDWTCNIGEQVQHLVYHYNKSSKKYDVVVVGEQTFFILVENDGKLRYQRRLEYTPSCVKTYHVPGINKDIFENEERSASTFAQQALQGQHDSPCFSFIMGSFSHYLMIYKDVQLVWTAKTQNAPIYVNTLKVGGQDGLIVTLSDNGWLQVVYLGTDAPPSQIQPQEPQDNNYEQMDLEHQRLLSRIRNQEDEKQVEPEDGIIIITQLSSFIEATNEYFDDPKGIYARSEQGKIIRMSMKITLGYKSAPGASGMFKNVQLSVALPNAVITEQTTFKYDNLSFNGRQTPPVMKIFLYPLKTIVPTDSKVIVTATYQSQQMDPNKQGGSLRTSMAEVQLPLSLFVYIGPPGVAKDPNDFKINLILSKTAPSAVSLFEDVIESLQAREICTNKKQLSFTFHNSVTVSLLVSKDDLKIRLQCPEFTSMWFVMKEMIRRLTELYAGNDDPLEITFPDAIPLNELFTVIDEHSQIRIQLAELKKSLDDRSYQFRIIQKRLLNRFKDKNPSPLNNLDFLLNHTYVQIIDAATQIEELKSHQKSVSNRLSSAVEIILLLLKIRFKITDEEYEILRMHLSPYVDDDSEHGWEDVTYAAMSSLLKTCLAKGGKGVAQVANQIKTLQDVSKLKQNITLVCDRIAKGAKIEL